MTNGSSQSKSSGRTPAKKTSRNELWHEENVGCEVGCCLMEGLLHLTGCGGLILLLATMGLATGEGKLRSKISHREHTTVHHIRAVPPKRGHDRSLTSRRMVLSPPGSE